MARSRLVGRSRPPGKKSAAPAPSGRLAAKPRRMKPPTAAPRARAAPGAVVPDGGFIRTVPLHYPRPVYTPQEHAALISGRVDLYDGKPHAPPATAHLSYRNGPLLVRPAVYAVYWGASWNTAPSARILRGQIDQFFRDILVSPLMDQLAEYNVKGQSIGHGQYLGSAVRTDGAPSGSVTDAAIRAQITQWLRARILPAVTPNSLYFIYLEPGVVSVMGGSKSCQNYCGYHDAAGSIYYAVMPYPLCAGCLGGLAALDALTATSSHELCEAITDPVPGSGWYDDVHGEIGDICAWNFRKIGVHSVQQEWSNAQQRCV